MSFFPRTAMQVIAVLILLCGVPAIMLAELACPRIDVLSVLGLAAGSELEITLQGNDLEGLERLRFDHPGLSATLVKDRTFTLRAAADVPPGTYELWGVGPLGITNSRLISVSSGLTDIAEVEPNQSVQGAQQIPLNSAVNGQFDGNGIDVFKFSLLAGQRVVVDCLAARVESDIDAMLTLKTATGVTLGASSDVIGRDPQLAYTATEASDVCVEVFDLTYRGGVPYRLVVTDQPYVENVFPRVIAQGQPTRIQVFGRNLGSGATPSTWSIDGQGLEQLTMDVTPTIDLLSQGRFVFREHPIHHSVLPTAATCTLVGQQFSILGGPAQCLLVTDQPTTIEAEPNNRRDQPQQLTLPALVSARFDQPRDADWYSFETGPDGGQFAFEVYSERIAGRADPALAVLDQNGNRVFELDDFGHRINSFDGHLRDPSGMTSLSANQTYHLVVQDRYQRGGARTQYVLAVRRARPDYFPAVMTPTNELRGTTLLRGGATQLDIVIHREEGHNSPITLEAQGLPAGVHARATTIPNDTRGIYVLWADIDATLGEFPITILARSEHQGQSLTREVRVYQRTSNNTGTRPLRELPIAVRSTSPYGLSIEPAEITVEAGQSVDLKLRAQRHWSDFKGAINYQPLQFPGGFELSNGTLGEGQTETTLSVKVQESIQPGTYTIVVQGQAQVPYNKDPQATERPNTLVSVPCTPVSVTVLAKPKLP